MKPAYYPTMMVLMAVMMAFWAAAPSAPTTVGPAPALREIDRVRLAEAFRLADEVGDRIWKGWHRAPFAVLLVTPEAEYLVGHPAPPKEYVRAGHDPLLGADLYVGARAHQLNLLATFPIAGVPTIVAGAAEATEESTSTRWVTVLQHEHFHQLQYSQPGYMAELQALGLAGGDDTGMWMLNYRFPYDVPEVQTRFAAMARALSDVIGTVGTPELRSRHAAYRTARAAFLSALSNEEKRYFLLQTWQEGVAMYTQLKAAEAAAGRYQPTARFTELADYTPFRDEASRLLDNIRNELPGLPLGAYRRVAFYYIGAAEALALDELSQRWRGRYFDRMFTLDPLMEE